MTRRTFAVLAALTMLLAAGCAKKQPILSGGKPIDHWVEVLKGPDAGQRKKAVRQLGNAGPDNAAVLPAVLEALQDADPAVRCEAIRVLANFGPKASPALPALQQMQQADADPQVRDDAARAWARLNGK